jgi:hypothetical protein
MPSPSSPQHQPDAGEPRILGHHPDIGTIFLCHKCDQVHVALGHTHLQMEPDAFRTVAGMIERATSNFELMLEADREPCV